MKFRKRQLTLYYRVKLLNKLRVANWTKKIAIYTKN